MHKLKYTIASLLIMIVVISCQLKDKKASIIEVNYSGALRTLMSGNIEPVISLDSLSDKKNFYALGAVEHLKGEIQIFDSKPSNSIVMDSSLQIEDSYNLKAALLVYAEVEEWGSYKTENSKTKDELEEYKLLDPIESALNVIKQNKYATEKEIEVIKKRVADQVAESIEFSENSNYPDASELYKDVYMQEDYPFITE